MIYTQEDIIALKNANVRLTNECGALADERDTLAKEHKLHIETITRLTKERDALAAKVAELEREP